MNPEFEYAYHWLRDTAVFLQRPFDLHLNREWIEDIEGGRPGFAAQLRLVALDALGSENDLLVHKAVAALAIVGERSDIPPLRIVEPRHAKAVRTAVFEIEHATPAG